MTTRPSTRLVTADDVEFLWQVLYWAAHEDGVGLDDVRRNPDVLVMCSPFAPAASVLCRTGPEVVEHSGRRRFLDGWISAQFVTTAPAIEDRPDEAKHRRRLDAPAGSCIEPAAADV
jgi:hypothetical protein